MRAFAVFLAAIVLVLAGLWSESAGIEPIKDGDPLRLYLSRSPTQNQTFLKYYKMFNESSNDNPGYILTLGPRDSGTDSVTVYFPTSNEDNSLKFIPNETVQASYSFSILGRLPSVGPGGDYRVKVTIQFDHSRDGNFRTDKEHSFIITGPLDGKLKTMTGNMTLKASDLKRTDPVKGGRLRIMISRDDYEVPSVLLYAGYRGANCELTLPMSRNTTIPKEKQGSQLLILGVFTGLAIVAMGVYIVYSMRKGKESKPKKDDRGKAR